MVRCLSPLSALRTLQHATLITPRKCLRISDPLWCARRPHAPIVSARRRTHADNVLKVKLCMKWRCSYTLPGTPWRLAGHPYDREVVRDSKDVSTDISVQKHSISNQTPALQGFVGKFKHWTLKNDLAKLASPSLKKYKFLK